MPQAVSALSLLKNHAACRQSWSELSLLSSVVLGHLAPVHGGLAVGIGDCAGRHTHVGDPVARRIQALLSVVVGHRAAVHGGLAIGVSNHAGYLVRVGDPWVRRVQLLCLSSSWPPCAGARRSCGRRR